MVTCQRLSSLRGGFVAVLDLFSFIFGMVMYENEFEKLGKTKIKPKIHNYVIFNQSISVHLEVLLPFSQTYSIYLFSIPV